MASHPTTILPLPDFRLPNYPSHPLSLDAKPLAILDITDLPSHGTTTMPSLTPALGLATLLHAWHPTALTAFLDLDAWFSFTFVATAPHARFEIGRIGRAVSFGTLDAEGETWELVLGFEMGNGEGEDVEGEGGRGAYARGEWIANAGESMRGGREVRSSEEVVALGVEWVVGCLVGRVWEGKGGQCGLWVEYAPMDIWGDGIAMAPHWLYAGVELGRCAGCGVGSGEVGGALQRCGRCGTAAYCGGGCQRGDWKVHKFICGMGVEERGQALRLAEKGGLIAWDVERMFAEEGSGVVSGNCNLPEGVPKRTRRVERPVDEGVQGLEHSFEDLQVA